MNKMQEVRIEKVTLNIGAGKEQAKLEKGIELMKSITGINPVKTITNKRIIAWGLRPGLPIGCKVTLRKKQALEMIPRLLSAKDFTLKERQFDMNGNLSFGIAEHINIEGAKYDPKIGVMGLEACITFEKAGYRVGRRKIAKSNVSKKQRVKKEEAIEFMKNKFNIKIGDSE